MNGGSTPAYQWKVNGTNVGTNSPTYTTTTLTNGQIVSCVMTSNATCASPATATSNSITMTITGTGPCTAGTTYTTYEYISKVAMGSIFNTTTSSSYSNYTSLSTTMIKGTAYPITVTIGNAYSTDKVLIWCDWNNNGSFTDAGEAVYVSASGVGPFSTSITAPLTAVTGTVRMRIRLTDGGAGPNLTPCGTSTYGEVEDYSLNLVIAALAPLAGETTSKSIEQNDYVPGTEVLNVFPNPNQGTFTVTAAHAGTYYLVNEQGQLIRTISLNEENNFTVRVDGLTTGCYILSGQNKFGVSKQKIVVGN